MKTLSPVSALVVLVFLPVFLSAQNPGMIEDLYTGPSSAFYAGANLSVSRDVLDGALFFSADNGVSGQEIHLSTPPYDANSTALLKDMTPGAGGSSKYYTTGYGRLFFTSHANVGSEAICRSDGSVNGTDLLYAPVVKKGTSSISVKCYPSQGMLFFTRLVERSGNPVLNFTGELWKTDPVSGASVLLKSGGFFSTIYPVNGTTVLIEYGKSSTRLYRTNGTAKKTTAYYTLPDSPDGPYSGLYSTCRTYIVAGTYLFFSWGDGVYGQELWKTDGTAQGTARVTDINPGAGGSVPAMGTVMNDFLYFAANDGTNGYQVWRIPITGGPAERVTNIDGGATGADPMWLTPMNDWLYFSAYTPEHGRELWRSNGLPLTDSQAQVARVTDINPGNGNANPNYAEVSRVDRDLKYMFEMAVMNGFLYFAADDGNGYALWRSDGATTQKLGASQPRLLTPTRFMVNGSPEDMLLFVAWSEAAGFELWKFDPAPPVVPKEARDAAADDFVLLRSHPDPFRTNTTLTWRIAEAGPVTLRVYDLHGRLVRTLVEGWSAEGSHATVFDAGALPSGVYVARLEHRGVQRMRMLRHVR